MKKILIVDDETEILGLIKKTLEKSGEYTVSATSNPLEVRQLCLTFQPDLVLLDLVMPQLEGPEVVKLLKSDPKTKHVKIIITSGMGEMAYHPKEGKWNWEPNRSVVGTRSKNIVHERSAERAAQVYGVDDFISKPFSPKILLDVVKDVLNRSAEEPKTPGDEV